MLVSATLLIFTLTSLWWGQSAARATTIQEQLTTTTSLVIDIPPLASVGELPELRARLSTTAGQPISDVGIEFQIDGNRVGRARTDAAGDASLPIRDELSAGDYQVVAAFTGVASRGLQPSLGAADLRVAPAVLEIATIPPLEGIVFSLSQASDDSSADTFVADEDGIARIAIADTGTYQLDVSELSDETSGYRTTFSRWLDETFVPNREVKITTSAVRLEAGFDVFRLVSQDFVDLDGQPVDPDRISSMTLGSSTGSRIEIDADDTTWLHASRVVRRSSGLEVSETQYSVESVMIDGSSVVHRAQQRFFPNNVQEWEIELLLYSAKFSARDALFRFPTGIGIVLEYPDGHTEQHSFGPSAELLLESLPRGEYLVTVEGWGIPMTRPLDLSRDQDVKLEVVSYLDVFVVLLVITAGILGLLFIGRPRLLSALRYYVVKGFQAVHLPRREDSS